MLRRTILRLNTDKVMGADYRALGLLYFDPVVGEVDTPGGLKQLREVESMSRVVVIIHVKAGDKVTREGVAGLMEEAELRAVNNRVLYAFSSYTNDKSLPCTPVVEVYSKGERIQRTLGRSFPTIRSTVPYYALSHSAPENPPPENWPTDTILSIPKSELGKVLKTVNRAKDPEVHAVLQSMREVYSLPQVKSA